MTSGLTIRDMTASDAEAVLAIYAEGIATGHATFATSPGSWEEWDSSHTGDCRLVALLDDAVAGWAALSPGSGRCVYRGVAEVSVYVGEKARGRGIGGALLSALISHSEANGYWTLTAGIFPENQGSLAAHEKRGFERMGLRRGLGRMSHGPLAGTWRDVVALERRSDIVGR